MILEAKLNGERERANAITDIFQTQTRQLRQIWLFLEECQHNARIPKTQTVELSYVIERLTEALEKTK